VLQLALPDPRDAAEIAKKFGYSSPQIEQLRQGVQNENPEQIVLPGRDQPNPVQQQSGNYRLSETSVGSLVANSNGPAPLQGYDVGVWVTDVGYNNRASRAALLGQFTNIVITVRNISDPYMAVGYRQPLYLDGEVQIAFTLEKGLLDIDVFTETFGFDRFERDRRFNRTPRFDITFSMDPVDWNALGEASKEFNEVIMRKPVGRFVLSSCKIESFHLGASAGKSVIATQWQGIAHGIRAIRSNLTQQEDLLQKSSVFSAHSGNRDEHNLPAGYQGLNVAAITDTSKDVKPQSTGAENLFAAGTNTLTNILQALRSLKLALPNDPTLDQSIQQVSSLLGNMGTTRSMEKFDLGAAPKIAAPKSSENSDLSATPKVPAPRSTEAFDVNQTLRAQDLSGSVEQALTATQSNLSARLNQLQVQLAGERDVLARRRLQDTINQVRATLGLVQTSSERS
jgi:hypothetical protein